MVMFPLVAALWAVPAAAAGPSAPSTPAAPQVLRPEWLLVDVRINSQALADVARVEQWPDGTLLLSTETWTEARLAPLAQSRFFTDGTPAYALDALPGASYRINRQSLSLEISVPASALVGSTRTLQSAWPAPPPRPQFGGLLNYDMSVMRSGAGGSLSGGALLEAVGFGRWGHLVHSVLVRSDAGGRSTRRLNTSWRYDLPQRLETLVVGDTVGVGGGWSRPVRYGGVRWGRDFGMRPGFVTLPPLTLSGEAVLPSTVDVLVNNARRLSQTLPAGPFELNNVPFATGAGQINLVVRDLLGRETVVSQRYYASPRLLAPGLSDFSGEAGWLRTGYGEGSTYGAGFGAVTWRQGLSHRFSGEARLELQAERRAGGVELAGLLGHWAVGRVALAASSSRTQGRAERGQLLQLGVERSTSVGGGSLQYEHASQGFAPLGEVVGPTVVAQRARTRWLASLGGAVGGPLHGGLSYASQTRWDGDRVKTAGLSLSFPLWQRAGLGVSLNKRLDGDGAWRAGVSVSLPLNSSTSTSARLEAARGSRVTGAVSTTRNPPVGSGLGWRLEGAAQSSLSARGGVQYHSPLAEFSADVVSGDQGQVSLRGGMRGTLGLLAGLPFASRPVGQGGFAVVDVGGLVGVPVLRSHQVVTTTDARGLAFVPGLLPWQKNQIEIDPVDLPLDVEVGNVVQQVTPYPGSGSVVKFAVRRTRQALVVLQQVDGQPVPVGAQVRLLPGGVEFRVGRRGEVWLIDLAAGPQPLHVLWSGGGCALVLDVPAGQDIPAKIGPLTCAQD
jgi:outer membrane usher protein